MGYITWTHACYIRNQSCYKIPRKRLLVRWGPGEETPQKFIHTYWSAQEALSENFEVEWNSANPGVPSERVLDLDSKARNGALPTYLVVVEANEISLKLQNPLLTRWWHVNVCAMQAMSIYKVWVKLLEHMRNIWQGDRLSSIAQNGIAPGKSKNLNCNGSLFCAFRRALWARHMK